MSTPFQIPATLRVFRQLLKVARHEFSRWSIEDDTIFARLRIWAAGKSDLVPNDQFSSVLADVSDKAFWDGSHEWDLLHTLLTRWNGLSADTRVEIENRLLKGRSRRDQETEEDFREYSAWSILARITWLSQKGCNLNLNLEEETDRLRELVPEWKPEDADAIVRYGETRGGIVSTETDHSALLDIPLASVLPEARRLRGRRDEPLVEYNPFAGLSADRPVRAFSALRIAAKEGDFPAWAWSTFLNAEKRKTDKPRFMMLIAERLAGYLDNGKTELVRPAADWLVNVSGRLSDESFASFHRVTIELIRALKRGSESGASEIWQVDGVRVQEWANAALNAPAGKIAQSVLCRAQKTDFLEYADELLALPGDLRRHVLVMFAQLTDWFYRVNREWSERNLLSVLDSGDPHDRDAFWEGFFLRPKVNQELFMRLKPNLLRLAKKDGKKRRRHSQGLSSLILSGWGSFIEGTCDRCISNEEFRTILVQTDDKFRSYALWHLEKRSCDENEETKNKWTSWLPEFLKDVWPYQRKANSPAVSASLCNLMFSNEELFPELVEIILPRLAKIDGHNWGWFKARDQGNRIITVHVPIGSPNICGPTRP